MRICVFTSCDIREPRGVKHAVALAELSPRNQITFIETYLAGGSAGSSYRLQGVNNVQRISCALPNRASSFLKAAASKLEHVGSLRVFGKTGIPLMAGLSARAAALRRTVRGAPEADLYIGHGIEALPILAEIAEQRGVPVVFDSMEYHSDMGAGQDPLEQRLIKVIESRCLHSCALVLTASEDIARALEHDYGITNTLSLYNTPPITELPPINKPAGLHLYWRNSLVGLGPRGLDDALVALTHLPEDVVLHVQGNPDGGGLSRRVAELRLQARVITHGPYTPEDAVREAAAHHVGLCLERDTGTNHRVTVSNKLFDYMMAGLAVVVSDMPSLRRIAERAGGGLVFRAGDPLDLAGKLRMLHARPDLLVDLAARNRAYALREANDQVDMARLKAKLVQLVPAVAT